MANTTPFLYAIGWTELNIWYIGVRWREGCEPLDLWTTYFTSSKFVKALRDDYGEPDHLEILMTGSRDEVLSCEEMLISHFALHRDPRWLNRCAGGRHFHYQGCSPATRDKISKANKGREVSQSDKSRLAASTTAAWSKPNNKLKQRVQPSAVQARLKLFTAWGITKTLGEWLEAYPDVSFQQFNVRINQGWTVERSLSQQPRIRRSLK